MPSDSPVVNRVRSLRAERGWSQGQLAERAGISRASVSAIETDRLVPSVAAALSLAEALGTTVEALFGRGGAADPGPTWAWPPTADPVRFWEARVADRTLRYPVEATVLAAAPHDGVVRRGEERFEPVHPAEGTLVLAGCDPGGALLAAEYARRTPFRMVALLRSSREALRMLAAGLVHVAGVHLSAGDSDEGNVRAVREELRGAGQLLRIARWQEGVALGTHVAARSVRAALASKLAWVGREPGSGARQCLDELFEHRLRTRRIAYDHRGVAEAVRCGWADAGVCLRLASEEAGLRFLSVREEPYDLCFRSDAADDPRLKALVRVVRSPEYRRLVGDLPGYDPRDVGELTDVAAPPAAEERT